MESPRKLCMTMVNGYIKIFKRFLEHNNIKDKPIPNSYPTGAGKVEAYNKIVKNEFISSGGHIKHR